MSESLAREVEELRDLNNRLQDIALPELRRGFEAQREAKKRWRDRAQAAETHVGELAIRARRVAISHEHFIWDHSDPGTEALAAQYELINYLSAMPGETELPLNPVENALRLVLALLDEYDENVTPGEIRKTLADFLPRDDASDRRFRIYIDGKGNGWIEVTVEDDGTQYLADIHAPNGPEVPASKVKADTGSLREIGRCW